MRGLKPESTIGILGGGQLGRMLAMAASRLGLKTHIFSDEAGAPAFDVAAARSVGSYTDGEAVARFAASVDVVTCEFENVPAASLDFLAHTARVTPSAASVAIAQDRISEKMFLSGHGFAVAPFAILRSEQDLEGIDAARLLPGIVKSARFGYDGKGQASVASLDDVRAAWRGMSAQGRSQARIGLEAQSAESSSERAQACVLERRTSGRRSDAEDACAAILLLVQAPRAAHERGHEACVVTAAAMPLGHHDVQLGVSTALDFRHW